VHDFHFLPRASGARGEQLTSPWAAASAGQHRSSASGRDQLGAMESDEFVIGLSADEALVLPEWLQRM